VWIVGPDVSTTGRSHETSRDRHATPAARFMTVKGHGRREGHRGPAACTRAKLASRGNVAAPHAASAHVETAAKIPDGRRDRHERAQTRVVVQDAAPQCGRTGRPLERGEIPTSRHDAARVAASLDATAKQVRRGARPVTPSERRDGREDFASRAIMVGRVMVNKGLALGRHPGGCRGSSTAIEQSIHAGGKNRDSGSSRMHRQGKRRERPPRGACPVEKSRRARSRSRAFPYEPGGLGATKARRRGRRARSPGGHNVARTRARAHDRRSGSWAAYNKSMPRGWKPERGTRACGAPLPRQKAHAGRLENGNRAHRRPCRSRAIWSGRGDAPASSTKLAHIEGTAC